MITIEIHEEVATSMDLVDLLNHIATMVKSGHTSGFSPGWKLVGEEEPTIT